MCPGHDIEMLCCYCTSVVLLRIRLETSTVRKKSGVGYPFTEVRFRNKVMFWHSFTEVKSGFEIMQFSVQE